MDLFQPRNQIMILFELQTINNTNLFFIFESQIKRQRAQQIIIVFLMLYKLEGDPERQRSEECRSDTSRICSQTTENDDAKKWKKSIHIQGQLTFRFITHEQENNRVRVRGPQWAILLTLIISGPRYLEKNIISDGINQIEILMETAEAKKLRLFCEQNGINVKTERIMNENIMWEGEIGEAPSKAVDEDMSDDGIDPSDYIIQDKIDQLLVVIEAEDTIKRLQLCNELQGKKITHLCFERQVLVEKSTKVDKIHQNQSKRLTKYSILRMNAGDAEYFAKMLQTESEPKLHFKIIKMNNQFVHLALQTQTLKESIKRSILYSYVDSFQWISKEEYEKVTKIPEYLKIIVQNNDPLIDLSRTWSELDFLVVKSELQKGSDLNSVNIYMKSNLKGHLLLWSKCISLKFNCETVSEQQASTIGIIILKGFSVSTNLIAAIREGKNQDILGLQSFLSQNKLNKTQFQTQINYISKNWDVLRAVYESKVEELLDIFQKRIFSLTSSNQLLYNVAFPQVEKLNALLERVTEYVSREKNKKIQGYRERQEDRFYIYFYEDLFVRTIKTAPFMVYDPQTNARVPLSDLIAKHTGYFQNPVSIGKWQDLFAMTEIYHEKSKYYGYKDIKLNPNLAYSNNLDKERLVDYSCISCCSVLYAEANFYLPYVNRTPIIVAGKVTAVIEEASDLKDRVCWLLNNRGGVILFNVVRTQLEMFPSGEYFTRLDQEAFQQKIERVLEGITPRPQTGENIEITFVPILQNPKKNMLVEKDLVTRTNKSYNQSYYSRPHIRGLYVTRIKVEPTAAETAYYWMADTGQAIFPKKVSQFSFVPMTGAEISVFLRQKIIKNYIPNDLDPNRKEQMSFNAPQISCFHTGKCETPDPGIMLTNTIEQFCEQKTSLPDKYDYMSLLLARKTDHSVILERLRRKNIQCKIENLYQRHSFKAANNSAAFYHNISFSELLSKVSYNKEYSFNGKYVMIINVAPYLKLPNMNQKNELSVNDCKNLENWLHKEHPEEKLKFWKFGPEAGNYEYFIQTESRESTVLMYYVLTQYGEKAIFRQIAKAKGAKKLIYPINTNENAIMRQTSTFHRDQRFDQTRQPKDQYDIFSRSMQENKQEGSMIFD